MISTEMEITFSGVAKQSGVGRSFLYKDFEIKQEIEKYRIEIRDIAIRKTEQQKKVSKSRDTVIEAKYKRIKSWRKKSGN